MFCTSPRSRRCVIEPPECGGLQLGLQRLVDPGHWPVSVHAGGRGAPGDPGAVGLACSLVGSAQSIAQDRTDNAAEPPRPLSLTLGVADQVLADLDDGVDEAPAGAVLPEAIALELAGIGLVLADDQVALGVEALEQRPRQPRVLLVPQHADVPGPRHHLPALGEGMDRQQDRRRPAGKAGVDDAIDGAVVGVVAEAGAPLALGLVEVAIAGDHRPVGEAHDLRRVVAASVRVDQQARVARQHGRHVERRRQVPRHLPGADVIGDVPLELVGGQAQRPVCPAAGRCRHGRRAGSRPRPHGPEQRKSCPPRQRRRAEPSIRPQPCADYSKAHAGWPGRARQADPRKWRGCSCRTALRGIGPKTLTLARNPRQ